MSSRDVLVVVGATGMQGGGLARAALADPRKRYSVRALTRNPDSEAAQVLAGMGAETVRADLNDQDSVTAAFEGATAAFLVTNWLELMSPQAEIEQARNMARAAHVAGIDHVIWSTFEDSRKFVKPNDPNYPDVLGYKVPHIDAKASVDRYFTELGVPTTFLRTAFFWDNFTSMISMMRGDDGRLVLPFAMADSRLAGIAGEDIGSVALGILKGGDRFVGETVSIAGEHLTGIEIAECLADAMGESVQYRPVDVAVVRQGNFPLADDVANMFQFFIDHDQELVASRSVELSRELHPRLASFTRWAQDNRERLRAAIV